MLAALYKSLKIENRLRLRMFSVLLFFIFKGTNLLHYARMNIEEPCYYSAILLRQVKKELSENRTYNVNKENKSITIYLL